MNEIATVKQQGLVVAEQVQTAAQIRAQVNLIQEVMQSVMKEGTHYGTIPGCNAPSLYKPGAEKIMATFRLAAEPVVEDLSTHDEIRYRIKVRMRSPSGVDLGAGVGECSSSEEKYKWRNAICDDEFNATPEDRRRIKYGRKKGGGHYTQQQIRTQPADLANTILKMAKKRALIDAVLTTTAASDIFTQDIEDVPEEMREAVTEAEPVQKPQSKSGKTAAPSRPATDGQKRVIRAKMDSVGVPEKELIEKFGEIDNLQATQVNDVLQWLSDLNG